MEILLAVTSTLLVVLLYDKYTNRKTESIKVTEEEEKEQQAIVNHYKSMIDFNHQQALRGDD